MNKVASRWTLLIEYFDKTRITLDLRVNLGFLKTSVVLIFEVIFLFEVVFIFEVIFIFEDVFIFEVVFILEVVSIF